MDAIVADTSVLLDYFERYPVPALERALDYGTLVLPPLVVGEIVSGDLTIDQKMLLAEILTDSLVHETPLAHWIYVGELRRKLRRRGLNVTLPDAHVAQCAIELDALLLTRDDIFPLIARHTSLRVTSAAS